MTTLKIATSCSMTARGVDSSAPLVEQRVERELAWEPSERALLAVYGRVIAK